MQPLDAFGLKAQNALLFGDSGSGLKSAAVYIILLPQKSHDSMGTLN
jgi:hypothetical protein